VRLIPDRRNTLDLLLIHQFSRTFNHTGLIHLIGNFGYDNLLPVVLRDFYLGLGAHYYTATSGFKSTLQPGIAVNSGTGREIRAFDILHQFRNIDIPVVDIRNNSVDYLT